jgi:hypothetical protein
MSAGLDQIQFERFAQEARADVKNNLYFTLVLSYLFAIGYNKPMKSFFTCAHYTEATLKNCLFAQSPP